MSEFVPASRLYDVDSRTPITHPAHQATDDDVRRALEEREIRTDSGHSSSSTEHRCARRGMPDTEQRCDLCYGIRTHDLVRGAYESASRIGINDNKFVSRWQVSPETDDRKSRTDGDTSSSGTYQVSSIDSLKSSFSTRENDVLPHRHPFRDPIGRRSPSAVFAAATAVPHWSQIARQCALSSSSAISYRFKSTPHYLDLSESTAIYHPVLQLDKNRVHSNPDRDDCSLHPRTELGEGER